MEGGGGGGDLETGMGWGKERWREVEEEREWKGMEGGVSSCSSTDGLMSLFRFPILLQFFVDTSVFSLCRNLPRAVLRRESTCAMKLMQQFSQVARIWSRPCFPPSLSYLLPGSRLWWTGRSSEAQRVRVGSGHV